MTFDKLYSLIETNRDHKKVKEVLSRLYGSIEGYGLGVVGNYPAILIVVDDVLETDIYLYRTDDGIYEYNILTSFIYKLSDKTNVDLTKLKHIN